MLSQVRVTGTSVVTSVVRAEYVVFAGSVPRVATMTCVTTATCLTNMTCHTNLSDITLLSPSGTNLSGVSSVFVEVE